MISSFDNGRYLGLESIVFKFFWRDDKFMFYVCFISFPNKECEVFIPRPWLMRHPPSPRESHLSGLRTEYYWYWLLSVLTTRLWMKFMQNAEKFVAYQQETGSHEQVGYSEKSSEYFIQFVVFVLKPFQCIMISVGMKHANHLHHPSQEH